MATIDEFITACQELDHRIGEPGSPALLFALTATGAMWNRAHGTLEENDSHDLQQWLTHLVTDMNMSEPFLVDSLIFWIDRRFDGMVEDGTKTRRLAEEAHQERLRLLADPNYAQEAAHRVNRLLANVDPNMPSLAGEDMLKREEQMHYFYNGTTTPEQLKNVVALRANWREIAVPLVSQP